MFVAHHSVISSSESRLWFYLFFAQTTPFVSILFSRLWRLWHLLYKLQNLVSCCLNKMGCLHSSYHIQITWDGDTGAHGIQGWKNKKAMTLPQLRHLLAHINLRRYTNENYFVGWQKGWRRRPGDRRSYAPILTIRGLKLYMVSAFAWNLVYKSSSLFGCPWMLPSHSVKLALTY